MSIKPSEARAKLFASWSEKDAEFMQNLVHKSKFLQQINQQFLACLPLNLQPWFRVANLHAGKLILYTTKATYIRSFKFIERSVIKKLQQELPWVTGIEVKVRPQVSLVPKVTYRETRISEKSQVGLAKLASSAKNPKLKQALLVLAQKKTARS